MRHISIIGSTGSIGTQALQVAALHPERFRVAALCARQNAALLFEQVRRFRPMVACLTGGRVSVPDDLSFCHWVFGPDAWREAVACPEATDVLVSVVGVCGLPITLEALRLRRRVLLANKETLVAGGALVERALCALPHGETHLVPVDSEHSAIFQCLRGEEQPGNEWTRLYLTASGGPFRTWGKAQIERATPEQALHHPNWHMGAKVTIDSASMFNKALEIIEAGWLFHARQEQIHVLIHPQSIVHSMVAYRDGAVKAQLGVPDMRLPILYAMTYPEGRLETGAPPLDFAQTRSLTFDPPDMERFPALTLGYRVLTAGGASGAVLNAANEVAVAAFLRGEISFGRIYPIVADTMDALGDAASGSVEAVMASDYLARECAQRAIARFSSANG